MIRPEGCLFYNWESSFIAFLSWNCIQMLDLISLQTFGCCREKQVRCRMVNHSSDRTVRPPRTPLGKDSLIILHTTNPSFLVNELPPLLCLLRVGAGSWVERGWGREGSSWERLPKYAHTRGQHRATDSSLLKTQDNLTDLQIQGSDQLFTATVGLLSAWYTADEA